MSGGEIETLLHAVRDHRDRVRKPLEAWAFGRRFGEPWMPDGLADSAA